MRHKRQRATPDTEVSGQDGKRARIAVIERTQEEIAKHVHAIASACASDADLSKQVGSSKFESEMKNLQGQVAYWRQSEKLPSDADALIISLIASLTALHETAKEKQQRFEGNNSNSADGNKKGGYQAIVTIINNYLSQALTVVSPFSMLPTQLPAYANIMSFLNNADTESMCLVNRRWQAGIEPALTLIADDDVQLALTLGTPLRDYSAEPKKMLRAGHTRSVTCMTTLPNGKLVSGSRDNTLKIWDSKSGRCLLTLQGHTNTVYCVATLPNSNIVSGSWDNTLKIWDGESGRCLHTLQGHAERISCITTFPNGHIVSGSADNTLKIWDSKSRQCLHTLQEHVNDVNSVTTLPNGNIVSGSRDGTLKVWDSESGQYLYTLEGHAKWVSCVITLPNGNLVSGSYDNTLKIWDSKSGQCLHTLQGHAHWVSCVTILPNGNIVSGSADFALQIWDSESGQCLRTLEGHAAGIDCVTTLPNGNIASVGGKGEIVFWQFPALRHRIDQTVSATTAFAASASTTSASTSSLFSALLPAPTDAAANTALDAERVDGVTSYQLKI